MILRNGMCKFMFKDLSNDMDIVYAIKLKLKPLPYKRYAELDKMGALDYVERFVIEHGGLIEYQEMFCIIYNTSRTTTVAESFVHSCQMEMQVYTFGRTYKEEFVMEIRKLHHAYIPPYTVKVKNDEAGGDFQTEIIPKNKDLIGALRLQLEDTKSLDVVHVDRRLSSKFKGFDGSQKRPLVVDLDSPLACPVVNISSNEIEEFDSESNNLSLHTGFEVNKYKWYTDNDFVYICVDEYETYLDLIRPAFEFSMGVDIVISVICVSLSLLALIITLFSYAIHADLRRTLPGKNLMSLCGALVLAQSLYIVANFTGLQAGSTTCQFVGMSVHFSWLLTFFSMSACTFHMFRVLTRTRLSSESSGVGRFLGYFSYSIFCSLLFIGINIIISEQVYGHIGYGQHACYISSQYLLYFTFGLPLALVIISNVGMIITVIVKIRQTGSVSRNVQNQRNNIIIFAKLSTITGATWIFGFAYLWTDIAFSSYLFIVLNASQGLFICFAFVVNRRVFTMHKELVSGSKRSGGSSSVTKNTTQSC